MVRRSVEMSPNRFKIGSSNTFGDQNVGSDPGRSDARRRSSPVEARVIPLLSDTTASKFKVAPRRKRRRRTGPNRDGRQTRWEKNKNRKAAASAAVACANAARESQDEGKESRRFKADLRLFLFLGEDSPRGEQTLQGGYKPAALREECGDPYPEARRQQGGGASQVDGHPGGRRPVAQVHTGAPTREPDRGGDQ